MQREQPTVQPEKQQRPALREVLTSNQAAWRRDAFSPFTVWDEITTLRRAVIELQQFNASLIEKMNNCKGC